MQFDDPQPQPQHEQATFTDEPPRRGWFVRNWVWFVPLLILLFIIICAGCCTGMLTFRVGMLKASEPYQAALAAVREDPQVQEALGTPIEDDTWFPVGEIVTSNRHGDARLDFAVRGPKGRAHVRTESRMTDGAWQMTELVVTVEETGERIVLDLPDDGEIQDAPLWEP